MTHHDDEVTETTVSNSGVRLRGKLLNVFAAWDQLIALIGPKTSLKDALAKLQQLADEEADGDYRN